MKILYLLLVLEKSCRNISFFIILPFGPPATLKFRSTVLNITLWRIKCYNSGISLIKVPLLSLASLVLEINWHFVFLHSKLHFWYCIPVLLADKKWNRQIVDAMGTNRRFLIVGFCKSYVCFCAVMLVVISDGSSKQIQCVLPVMETKIH